MSALRDQIFSTNDHKTEKVTVPEWGNAEIYVATLSADERDEYEQREVASRGDDEEANLRGVRARLCVATCRDAEGKPVFEPGDEVHLGKKAARPVARLFDVAAKLNGLTRQDVDELVGNSEGGPTAA